MKDLLDLKDLTIQAESGRTHARRGWGARARRGRARLPPSPSSSSSLFLKPRVERYKSLIYVYIRTHTYIYVHIRIYKYIYVYVYYILSIYTPPLVRLKAAEHTLAGDGGRCLNEDERASLPHLLLLLLYYSQA